MYRFLHTADWQLGMRAVGLGPAADRVRAHRLTAVRDLLAVAAERQTGAVLVAGDAFEDNHVAAGVVEAVASILNDATACPIYLLPGNHDPLTPGSVWHRPIWPQLRPHVRVVTTPTPIALADGVTLFPCPLAAKHGTADPTAGIPPRGPGDRSLRVGLAHGTMRIRPGVGDDDFPIPLNAAARAGLDYLAMGHWHSVLSAPDGRAWYSGTPETTKFGERDSGRSLLVMLTEAGAPPTVEPVRTGGLTWAAETIDLDAVPADEIVRGLRERPDAERLLLRLTLTGRATPASAAAVSQLRAVLAERFLYADCDESLLRPGDPAAALADLAGAPHLIAAAEELRGLAESDPVAARALDVMFQCMTPSPVVLNGRGPG